VRAEFTPSEDVLGRVDADPCPCGAPPRAGSIYCSEDCVPTHQGADTSSDFDGTGMRWRPDLVIAVDDTGRSLLRAFQRGLYRAQIFEYPGAPGRVHLRLDDGDRFIGADAGATGNHEPVWRRLEREFDDGRDPEPDFGSHWCCRLPRRPDPSLPE
jgi:hypothetical protein